VSKPEERATMVGWYDPGQLAQTIVEVAISTIFGRESDFRMLEALTQPQDDFFPCETCEPGQPAWIDYVGDTGDGWNSTYSMAYWMTRPELPVASADGSAPETTRSGQVLIFGGDQVYPTASRSSYEQRLVAPYKAARESSAEPAPEVFAIPGNHDWYDNLVSFTRLFCDKEWFAGWRTRQKRSYFVLKLRYGWWLVGTDIQLGSDIDDRQLQYFKEAAKKMKPDDRIILCTAEPHWVYAEMYREAEPGYYNEKTLSFLESPKVFGDRIQIFVAGDLHHYRRHEGEDRRQKLTSGGGGAFLHPTHGPDVSVLHESNYQQRAAYPDPKTSRRLCWRNLGFPLRNPKFGVASAFLYLMVAWTILAGIGLTTNPRDAFRTVLTNTLSNPTATILVLVVFFGFMFFTDTHYRLFRYLGGGLHALLHLTAIFFIGWGASYFVLHHFPVVGSTPGHLIPTGILIFIAGWIIGSFIFGVYLLVSLNLFRRHSNEAFSSLRIEDYKNFLRFRIDPDGGMTIFPLGVEKVAKEWTPSSESGGPKYKPAGDFTKPFLIEKPIVITPKDLRRAPRTGV
jgi:hypothetical protein